ncbi:MAG: septal ring lytic transglycosylase RlpA family protein [Rhodospirillaceae bacterium]|nr:septal ring lytic transglycosylase RlpA family protein [Rhodospirillaceae bacterium]
MMGWHLERRRIFQSFLLLLAVLSLTACAESQLALHMAKQLQRAATEGPSPNAGAYKVGKPYQIKGVWYYPRENAQYDKTGIASWYGDPFHGRRTANGEIYNMNGLTAAHKTLPMPVRVRVTNLDNGRSLVLRINDRGPFVNGRIIDVSRRAAQLLGFIKQGTAKGRVTIVDRPRPAVVAKRAKTPPEQKNALPALPRGKVTAQTLAPPPGVKQSAQQDSNVGAVPVRIANAGPITLSNPVTGKIVQQPVGPSSIFIQAGAFSLAQNANRLRARLAYIGPSRIINVFIKGQEMFRVHLGPLKSVQAADNVLKQILDSGITNARIIVE